jgi:hypothetical protein
MSVMRKAQWRERSQKTVRTRNVPHYGYGFRCRDPDFVSACGAWIAKSSGKSLLR